MNIEPEHIKVYWSDNRNIKVKNAPVHTFNWKLGNKSDILQEARIEGIKVVVFVDIRLMYKSYYEGSCDAWSLKNREINDAEHYEMHRWHCTWGKLKFKNTQVDNIFHGGKAQISFYKGSNIPFDIDGAIEGVMLGFKKAYEEGKDYFTTTHEPPLR
jgi:hypothetical protein